MGTVIKYDKDIYWNPYNALSYNKMFNFIVGGTGIGKTFAMKKFCLGRFKKYREQFMWLRRYDEDNKDILTFFGQVDVLEQLGDTADDWKIDNKGKIWHLRSVDENGNYIEYNGENEKYIEKTKSKNGVATTAISEIRRLYKKGIHDNSFLKEGDEDAT